jgi:pSer/pThr/pTyr-binding forkhead associated (FHA) protein
VVRLARMPELTLEIVEGPDAGRQVSLDRAIEIGRGDAADLTLNDGEVSRRHARVTPQVDGAIVEDLGSSNGTFVNQNELVGPARITPGDELLVGVTVMQLRSAAQVAAQPSAVRPVPPALAIPAQRPTYVAPLEQKAPAPAVPELDRLVDARTKSQARTAPLAIFVLVVLAVLVYLGTQ